MNIPAGITSSAIAAADGAAAIGSRPSGRSAGDRECTRFERRPVGSAP